MVYFKPKFLFVKSNQISPAQTIAQDNILFSFTLQLPEQGGQAYPQAIRLEDLKGAATPGGLASTKAKSRCARLRIAVRPDPRQAKNPEDSFFWDFKDGRAALDPQWIENIYVAESFKITKSAFQEKDREPDQALIEAAVAEWRMTPKVRETPPFID